jgi:hypothetical protein
MHAEGLSASKIVKILGHGCTRNAVIGKVHRLKLCQEHLSESHRVAGRAGRLGGLILRATLLYCEGIRGGKRGDHQSNGLPA